MSEAHKNYSSGWQEAIRKREFNPSGESEITLPRNEESDHPTYSDHHFMEKDSSLDDNSVPEEYSNYFSPLLWDYSTYSCDSLSPHAITQQAATEDSSIPLDESFLSEKFLYILPLGYCEATLIAQSYPFPGLPGDHFDAFPNGWDTKFTFVCSKKIQVGKPGVSAETFHVKPERESRRYSLLKAGERNADNGLLKLIDELEREVPRCAGDNPDISGLDIWSESRYFLTEAIWKATAHAHQALWTSLTLIVVREHEYNKKNEYQNAFVKYYQDISTVPICSVCESLIDTTHDSFIKMPCGDYCHKNCIWYWPLQE